LGVAFGPICAISGKLAEKTRRISSRKGPEVAENGAFPRAKAPFSPSCEPTALDRKPLSCQSLRRELRPVPAPSGPPIRQSSAIFFILSVVRGPWSVVRFADGRGDPIRQPSVVTGSLRGWADARLATKRFGSGRGWAGSPIAYRPRFTSRLRDACLDSKGFCNGQLTTDN